ncbi:MAG: DMT family transporter [Chloroflexota bacterium]
MNPTLKMERFDWLLLLLLATLWGSSFLFMKIATLDLPVFTVVVGRIGIAGLLLTLFIYLRGLRFPFDRAFWFEMFLLGFLRAALPISLFVWASTQIDSNISGILNSTTPLFTAIIAHFLTQDERLNGQRIVGVLCGMGGVVLLVGIDALAGLGNNLAGQLAVLGATCSYGFAGVYGRRVRDLPVAVTTAAMLLASTLLILPLSLWQAPPWTLQLTLPSAASVLALAIFNTAIAFMVWLTIVRRAGANNSSQVTFIIPLVAIVLGFLVLGEQPSWSALAGLLFILLGLAIAQGSLKLPADDTPPT